MKGLPFLGQTNYEPRMMLIHEAEQVVHAIVTVKDIRRVGEPGQRLPQSSEDNVIDRNVFLFAGGVDERKQAERLPRAFAKRDDFRHVIAFLNRRSQR